jgi:hypothetical protein
MKIFPTLLTFLSATVCFSQDKLVQTTYRNESLGLGGSTLVLNTDGFFSLRHILAQTCMLHQGNGQKIETN